MFDYISQNVDIHLRRWRVRRSQVIQEFATEGRESE